MSDSDNSLHEDLLQLARSRELTMSQKREKLVGLLNDIRIDAQDTETTKARSLARHIEVFSDASNGSELGEALCMQAYFGFLSADSFITSVCIVLDACLRSGNIEIASLIGSVVSRSLHSFSTAMGLNEARRDELMAVIDRRLARPRSVLDAATGEGQES